MAVMGIGDASVQVWGRGRFDAQRNAVVSAYNGATAPLFYYWWRLLDRQWPGTSVGAVVRKALTNQLVVGPFNSALFLAWSTSVEAWLARSQGGALDAAALGAAVREKALREVPGLVLSSCFFWLPANATNFMFVPMHFRVLFMSSCAVAWGAYISYVVHR
mmetsp:Transcript_29658/g.44350  ORF Transcript_29658/g.44350 Transcript_29658/m.44350 type:complete len:161 (-) Transcript_29658:137-619(-)